MWNFQNIIVYIIVFAAVIWLVKKFFWKKKKSNQKDADKPVAIAINIKPALVLGKHL